VAFALPALVALARFKLCVLCGVPLHGSLLDVGSNVGGDGAAGGVGAGAAGNGWPGGVDPYPMIGGPDPGGGGGGGSGSNPPWWSNWQSWIPSSWTNIPLGGGFDINTQTGRIDLPSGGVSGGGFGVSESGSVGAAPGSASDGIVNVTVNTTISTPVGTVSGPSYTGTVGINQQNVPVGSVMGGQGTQGGAWLNSFMNGNN
jgi:hypothetical protein